MPGAQMHALGGDLSKRRTTFERSKPPRLFPVGGRQMLAAARNDICVGALERSDRNVLNAAVSYGGVGENEASTETRKRARRR